MRFKKDFREFLRTKHIVTHFRKFIFEKKLNSRVLRREIEKKKIGNRWFWELDTYFFEGEVELITSHL
jgi:hypothetical protein